MNSAPRITEIEVIEFEHELKDVVREPTIGVAIYQPGNILPGRANVIRIHTDAGITGEYQGGSATDYAGLRMFAASLVGRSALEREDIYNDAKQVLRHNARMGLGVVEIALSQKTLNSWLGCRG